MTTARTRTSLSEGTHAVTGLRVLGLTAMLMLAGTSARGQLPSQLNDALQLNKGAGNLPGLGGMIPSVDKASPSNTAGILQYCVRNNYLSGGAASSVKSALMGRLPGGGGTSNNGDFKAGDGGLLQTGGGHSFGLGGGGVKAEVTHKVCDLILKHAKSLL